MRVVMVALFGACGVGPALADDDVTVDDMLAYWRLPSHDTVVELQTSFGVFRLPIGYMTSPFILRNRELPDDGSGLHRYKIDELWFHFTMPDGHQNASREYFFAGDDGGDRIGIDPTRYGVWFTQMHGPKSLDYREMGVLVSDLPADRLDMSPRALSAYGYDDYYAGWTLVSSTKERVGFTMSCSMLYPPPPHNGLCGGWMYFENQKLDLQFLIQEERHEQIFAIARKTSEFLVEWRQKPY